MPLFFLLSGFCLALGNDKNVSYGTFLKKRVLRIYPIYLLTFLLLLPINDALKHPNKCITTLLMVQSWFTWDIFSGNNAEPFYSVNGFHETWTVSTLFFFYLLHPKLAQFFHNRSNKALSILIATSFILQLLFGWSLLILIPASSYSDQKGFRWATMWPLSRFPVFVMGVCAGVICQRIKSGDEDAFAGKLMVFDNTSFDLCQYFCDAQNLNQKML